MLHNNECQAVITAPTRELAAQIYEMAKVMEKG
jgi:superfamily II DNA/RNA helicase